MMMISPRSDRGQLLAFQLTAIRSNDDHFSFEHQPPQKIESLCLLVIDRGPDSYPFETEEKQHSPDRLETTFNSIPPVVVVLLSTSEQVGECRV